MNNVKVSISLVTYKPNFEVLGKTLRTLHTSFLASTGTSAHLYLIDNSCDSEWQSKISTCMKQYFPDTDHLKAELIPSPGNIGYGRANNIGIERASSDYHIVINPDIYCDTDTISAAINYMDQNPNIALLTPAIYGEDGERHYHCKRNPTLFIMFLRSFAPRFIQKQFSNYMNTFEMRDQNYDKSIDNIPFPSGCFMFFRTEILKQIHGFSPDYFMYFEDADIGRRILNVANSIYLPTVKVVHKWARGSRTSLKLRWIIIKSAFIYWRNWGGIF